jgi:hypothetical protein
MNPFLVFAVVLVASLVAPQVEHAPTVAQCQADQRLWLAKIEADANGDKTGLPNIYTMRAWGIEMTQCKDVDPSNRFKYFNTEAEIFTDEMLRLRHFLDRHDLMEKFIEEDAAGKR